MAYKSKVFDINKNFPYNVGVRKVQLTFTLHLHFLWRLEMTLADITKQLEEKTKQERIIYASILFLLIFFYRYP